ncbi:deoxyguanosinetriphosphate triphosphohydrolase [Ferribacterium limneticum]|uniref:deoxyguanosinetriphosphate triphosphohydrolase n=1 Tax=Ferribacterium limneticum TaxID=76259 RepID=UPI001CF926C8|nr:deoxyguanosinetriphosphate triphosphohydrolase [Ferribacterium limneticum]UCV24926.1 deoxyguanosinetriphosphate triphosphohydrolase [Ferribacterium limneticum]
MGKRKVWEKLLSSERLGAGKAPGTAERTAFQQDYDRIVFTSAFRRMKDKTQVFPLSKSDYVRTRLTHSLEVSCVGRSLGAVVGREIIARHGLQHVESGDFGAIVAAACLAHDIGNPPFGHAGEDAIREWFRHSGLLDRHQFTSAQKADFERYEGNAQGFRIVSRLQSPANPGGLQLSSAVLATFTKYPRPSHLDTDLDGKSGKKFGFFQQDADNFQQVARSTGLIERIPNTAWHRHPLAFLVEVADDTCYLIVDLEDAARLGFVPYKDAECLLADLAGNTINGSRLDRLHDPKERLEYLRAKAIGCLLESAAAVFLENEDAILSGKFDDELLESSPIAHPLQAILKLAKETIYTARPALEIETAGFEVLGALLGLFTNAVEARAGHARYTTRERMLLKLLPTQFLGHGGEPDADPYIRLLQVADFVAGMTDSYAVDMFRKLKGFDLPT